MTIRAAATACAALALVGSAMATAAETAKQSNSIERQITHLIAKMTLAEKAGQLNQSGLGTAQKLIASETGAGHIVNQQGGTTVAEVLFGDYNPGGKLTTTFPRVMGQLPVYYNYKPGWYSHGYCDGTEATPLFVFGHGRSYTAFEYDGLRLSSPTMPINGSVEVSVAVKNTGARRGDEVVQLYVCDQIATVVRPAKELKAFERITLDPSAKKTVTFRLGPDELSFHNREMRLVVEPGMFDIMVGSSSVDVKTVHLEVTDG